MRPVYPRLVARSHTSHVYRSEIQRYHIAQILGRQWVEPNHKCKSEDAKTHDDAPHVFFGVAVIRRFLFFPTVEKGLIPTVAVIEGNDCD